MYVYYLPVELTCIERNPLLTFSDFQVMCIQIPTKGHMAVEKEREAYRLLCFNVDESVLSERLLRLAIRLHQALRDEAVFIPTNHSENELREALEKNTPIFKELAQKFFKKVCAQGGCPDAGNKGK
jgi:hypothetical protein